MRELGHWPTIWAKSGLEQKAQQSGHHVREYACKSHAAAATANSSCQLSEIRPVRSREHGFLSGGVVRVFRAFRADIFHPFT